MADAAAAIRGQQYRFAEIEHVCYREATAGEGRAEGVGGVAQRQPGGGADHALAVARQHEHAIRRGGIGGQILALVIQVAGVQIRPVAEHGDAQPCDIVQERGDLRAAQALDGERSVHR
ncbi:Conserved hypothetical protein [Xanthomonas translucens pv. translucens DSM 18974]|uniref:Uncharacterized protein n=1 Tax=Xanthomonas translucens pv. translucens DSM 18974 TaxID=1261556 RepID=A0A1C3TLM1_XANCT|nr:hypothetical protein BN444_02489 [Xanthomonas translucens pv. translucens DSM 18974]SCB04118.1 Conserved hypothetical protein [Xanthomonas translucens pv. translucens DSM 18974]